MNLAKHNYLIFQFVKLYKYEYSDLQIFRDFLATLSKTAVKEQDVAIS